MPVLQRNQAIYYQVWQACPGPIHTCLFIFHGMAEHIGRYEDVAHFMNQAGIMVVGMDMRGHGQTGDQANRLGHLADQAGWELLLADQKALFETIKKSHPELKFVLLGHSMGSFLARHYLNLYPNDFVAAILMGTGKVNQVTFPFVRALLAILPSQAPARLIHHLNFGQANRGIQSPQTPHDWLSTDPQAVAAYEADPWCGFVPTNQFYRDLLGGLQQIYQLEKNINYRDPMLFIAGQADPIGSYGKWVKESANIYRAQGHDKVDLELVPSLRHELLMEVDKQVIYQRLLVFIKEVII